MVGPNSPMAVRSFENRFVYGTLKELIRLVASFARKPYNCSVGAEWPLDDDMLLILRSALFGTYKSLPN